MSIDDDRARYLAAAHAMQTGVALEHENNASDGSPKHLRVGVNSAMVDASSLARLLIDKGLITEAEYYKAIADGMEAEAKRYEDRLSKIYGRTIRLA